MKVAIVGTGRVGTAIAKALKNYKIVGLSSRKKEDAFLCIKSTGCSNWSSFAYQITRTADIVFLTVPDSKIEDVYKDIERNNGFKTNSVVIHTSGALSSDIFKEARLVRKGRLSMHPVSSFVSPNLPDGTIFALEGDEYGIRVGKQIVKDLNGKYFIVPKEIKPLYHAMLNFGASHLIALLQMGASLLEASGIKGREELILSLAERTLKNAKEIGLQNALTGPIERGDVETVELELKALKQVSPETLNIYKILSLETLKIAEKKGISSEKINRLEKLLTLNFKL